MQSPNDIARCDIIPLGTQTKYGIIDAVGALSGERYYWMVDEYKCVSMMPASIVEPEFKGGVCPERIEK